MIDKYLLQELGRRNDEKGELARWVIQLEADVDTERRKTAARDSVIYARDTRIAELEADVKVWESAATKHLARAEEAEKRLATPVRLPTTSGRLGVAYTRVIPEVIEAIRAAGFTVEGGGQDGQTS
ncbi:hypothetical protein [Serratia ureilytica]|uniref:hypothetical protein n=1 Tax=Serratia ureilytica TaxID=300181 RepID=UPI0019D0866D|nr:hypothetical protein [Serratia ureilytica]MBN5283336.1 hypothetical protein [Serratia ureilytica]MBN5374739.1 hypothetical protein [Serratia ureilytica]